MLIKKVENNINKNKLLDKGAHIVIGLSGGPDSVCLFDVLEKIGRSYDFTLHAVHVNHRIRPGAAEKDAKFVKKICAERKIDCDIFEVECKKTAAELGITDEEAGRKLRYEAFIKKANEINSEGIPRDLIKIAVAHNYNDQAETVLLRIIRGTGLDGLAGMSYERETEDGYSIIRPILNIRRDEIEAYCRENELAPRIDETNLKPLYNRNKVRLELIPETDRIFGGNFTGSLYRLAENAREDSSFIREEAEKLYEKAFLNKKTEGKTESVVFDRDVLRKAHDSILKRVVLKGLKKMGLLQDVTRTQLQAAAGFICGSNASGTIIFPHGYEMRVSYQKVFLGKKKGSRNFETDILHDADIKQYPDNKIIQKRVNSEGCSKGYSTESLLEIKCRIIDKKTFRNENADKIVLKDEIIENLSFQAGKQFSKKNEKTTQTEAVNNKVDEAGAVAYFDWDEICSVFEKSCGRKPDKEEITVRYRQPGDVISIKMKQKAVSTETAECCKNTGQNNDLNNNSNNNAVTYHRKKISRIFIDEKIPAEKRDLIPLVAIENEVLIIIDPENAKRKLNYQSGFSNDIMNEKIKEIENPVKKYIRINQRFHVRTETENVLIIEY